MIETNLIRVMIVDNYSVVRGGLKYFLQAFNDMTLAAEAASAEEALRLCQQVQPDVILMNMIASGMMNGIAAIQAIQHGYPQAKIIILTSFQNIKLMRRALQAGAMGYLLENTSIDELAQAIRAAYAGRPTPAMEVTQALVPTAIEPSPPEYELTKRELKVLALIVEGLSDIEIAQRLMVSPVTVRHHVSSMLVKLEAANRVEAAARAIKYHLVN